ncbi:DUF2381 family protein [Archangium violaceum]|uniref:DUF2381 family protein n=1 Tax=Archangium violaceum TaxID=83451 RepID=UPI00194EDB31|nr:DUF2381 family protein [Archangium violaceum]QRN98629.1 DUF2381 family protein [Archangium violaceum]
MLATLLRMALVLVTLVASAAWARPGPVAARVTKARQVVLREGPGESGELRVHPDYLTTVVFDVDVAPGAVEVEDAERVRVLGAQGRVAVLEPVRELAEGERVALWVTFTRGRTVTRAVLMLVPHPSEVDTEVRVALSEKLTRAVGPAEPGEPPTLMHQLLAGTWVLGKRLDGRVLHASTFPLGVEAGVPWMYELGVQRVVAIPVNNPGGAPPWEPRVVWLASEVLGPKPVALSARMRVPRLMPGERDWVFVEWPLKTGVFHLEVREHESGRGFRLEWAGPQ